MAFETEDIESEEIETEDIEQLESDDLYFILTMYWRVSLFV
jgi:hypothetical protein